MSVVDLKLARARELLETASREVDAALDAKEKGEPMKAGRLAASARRIANQAIEAIDSTIA